MGTVHWDTLCSYCCCHLFPMEMTRAEGVARPLLPCPQLGGATPLPPRTGHHCWHPPRSLRSRKGQGCEGTHHGAVPHHNLSPGRKGGQTPTTSRLLGVPLSPPRTEHHPWPLLRSLRDCEGRGCEGTHHGESPATSYIPTATASCPQAGGVAGPSPPCPQLLGVPPPPLRTEHHPWPLPRSPWDCEGQGCEGTHHGDSLLL